MDGPCCRCFLVSWILPVSQVPMDKFWIRLLTVLILLHQTMSARDTTEVFETVGGSVTFCIQDTSGRDLAIWSFGNVPIVTVPFKDPSKLLFANDEFEKRFSVSEKGRALSISQLTLKDAGTYSVNINGNISKFILRVYKELAEPTVTCEAQNCSSAGSCSFSLSCSVPGTDFGNISYTWRVGDRLWHEGSMVLWVNKSSLEKPLMCTAQNPVSNRSVNVSTPDMLCAETSTHSPSPGALSSSRVTIWVIAGVGILVLLSILLLFLRKSNGWREFRLSKSKRTDTEPTTVYAEVGPSQQHVPNRIKAKPMDGESPTTVYSVVKRPDQVENGSVTNLELL